MKPTPETIIIGYFGFLNKTIDWDAKEAAATLIEFLRMNNYHIVEQPFSTEGLGDGPNGIWDHVV